VPGADPNAPPAVPPPPGFYDYLRAAWSREVPATATPDGWRDALRAGVVTGAVSATAPTPAPASAAGLASLRFDTPATFAGDGEYHLLVYPSYRFWDGRHANKMWMQELPDPVSKFTWVSWVELNPTTAEKLGGLDTGHIVKVRTARGEVELPVFVHPGLREDVIAIQVGEGHTGLGRYARDRGVNPMELLQPTVEPASGALVWFQAKATVQPTGRWVRPPQHSIKDDQENREIAQTITLLGARDADIKRGIFAGLANEPAPAAAPRPAEEEQEEHVHPQEAFVEQLQAAGGLLPSRVNATPQGFPHVGMFWGEYTEAAPRWGMSIDLERCIGCSACITACYAENNIGVVGPDQVAMGRIMHWIRIERYFDRNDAGEVQRTHFLPMICQHCSNAPCEPVCPVYAAYHTPDGLNAQVYNRCVGTRYCSNNCPYKVRVFNWFTMEWPEPLNWQLNPDVTVREKGVMEKCTMCVQRIREAQNVARVDQRAVRDGEITPACAQTCPGDAIVFGNMADPNSRVSRVAASGRGYRVLEHLNTQSAITYLKRVTLEEAEA
jgi:molybdopterin-containing oxidoreductase family iron-sulfur binding subunit